MSKLTIAALSLALLASACFTAGPAHAQSANVNANIDVNRAVDQIVGGLNTLINGNRDREAVVRLTVDKVFDGLGGHYNVMVFNYDQECDYHLNVLTTRDLSIPGGHYRLFVFKDGTFENKGEGSYLNWGFSGAFERSGRDNKFVTFSRLDDFVYPDVAKDGDAPILGSQGMMDTGDGDPDVLDPGPGLSDPAGEDSNLTLPPSVDQGSDAPAAGLTAPGAEDPTVTDPAGPDAGDKDDAIVAR